MSVAKWLTRRVTFSFEGRQWPLIFTHRALLISEEITGTDMLSATVSDLSASMVRALLFSALTCVGAPCTEEQIGKRVGRGNLSKVKHTICDAWSASMADPKKEIEVGKSRFDTEEPEKVTWTKAWAIAREEHRLSSEEWLDMTPRQFKALQDVKLERWQREELLVGILASTVENFSMCAPKKPVTPEAFMLHKIERPAIPIGDQIMREMAKIRQQ